MPTFGCKNDEIRYMGVNLQQLFPVEPNHPAAFGMDVTDHRLGITVSLWDSKTCGATNHPFAVIKLGGDDNFVKSNIESSRTTSSTPTALSSIGSRVVGVEASSQARSRASASSGTAVCPDAHDRQGHDHPLTCGEAPPAGLEPAT
jgi:hypothetical protein